MKVVTYDEALWYDPAMLQIAYDILAKTLPKVSEKHKFDTRRIMLRVKNPLELIVHFTKGYMHGKRILDLGCGSSPASDFPEMGKDYEPWLCRILQSAGAYPIGVDIGNLDNEEFEHHSVDLSESNSLGFIPDFSIDMIHSNLLYYSPTLRSKHRFDYDLFEHLRPQLERIIKPNGIYLYHDV